MQILALTVLALGLALMGVQVSAATPGSYTCKVSYGTIEGIGHGSSLLKARQEARLDCGMKLIDKRFSLQGDVSAAEEIELAAACVNLDCK